MKPGWELKKLGDVCELSAGGDVPKNDFSQFKTEKHQIPIYSNGEKNDGLFGYTSIAKITEPSITVSARGTIGFSVTRLESFYPVVRLIVVTPKKGDQLNLDFLEYALQTIDFKHSGSSIPQLTVPMIRDYYIPIPPLPEQQRIVSILDDAFAAIEKAKAIAEQNLKNAKELFESYLQGVFEEKGDGWEVRKVSEIGKAQTGTTPKTTEKENYGDFIPFIKPADVDFSGNGDIRFDNEGLSEVGLKKGRMMQKGSVLMVCIGATIGKVGFTERDVSCNQQINSLTVKKEYDPKFIYYAMTSKAFQEKVILEGKGAQATLPIINKSKWESLTISSPQSVTEQQSIVRRLDALRAETQKLEAIYRKKLEDLDELKKSILQKAFKGELGAREKVAV